MSIHAIAYFSTARERLTGPESMDHLLADARDFNQQMGITGVLLHHDGNFFQYLEGAPDAVLLAYQRIRQSSAHYNIVEMLNSEVDQRHFPNWSMGFAETTRTELQQISQASWMEQLGQISSHAMTSPGLVLLLGFWQRSAPGTVRLPN